jgi:rhamnosyltransferase
MQTNSIHGVVVLYQPDDAVIDNILSYIDGLATLYVIDNSADPDAVIIERINAMPKCLYISNPENKGIASALNHGAKLAIDNGANWLLTMDQDSRFQAADFNKLLNFTEQQNEQVTGLVSPFHQTGVSVEPVTEVDEVVTIMTSGNLISLFAWQAIGGFDERYFIDAVDWDYCLRLNLYKFKVLRYNRVHLQHGLGNATKHQSITGKQITALNYNKIRRYYITRNKLLIIFKYYRQYPKYCYNVFKSLFRDLRHILLYEDGKQAKLWFMLKGFGHFLSGKTGRL